MLTFLDPLAEFLKAYDTVRSIFVGAVAVPPHTFLNRVACFLKAYNSNTV
jgi:hypothetical protein